VGGNAQTKATKKVAGKLKLDMAQYNELAAFAQFGAELDKTSMAQLNRGSHMVELMKQPQYSPMIMEEQVASIFAGISGYMDALPIEKVKPFEAGLLKFLREKHPEILKDIREKNDLTDDTKAKLTSAIEEFSKSFLA
jgi:F-type H+-transporting ATPase subunit alpha